MKLVRESLFSSTIRSFCISFFAVIGVVLAFFLIMVAFGAGKGSKSIEHSNFEIIIPDTNGRKLSPTNTDPLLLRIDIVGPIMPENNSFPGNSGVGLESIRAALNESRSGAFKKTPIKGLLLYINSPGGSGLLCEPIYESIKSYSNKYEVPVYVYVEGCCASAAMYIACAADKIYSNSSSIIGSVGAYWKFFNFSGSMDKVGVQNMTLKAGKGKDAMNPFQPWAEGASDNYQQILNEDYRQFVHVVSNARPKLTPSLLENKYGAQVFVAQQAQEYGYIDGAGYQYDQVVEMLAEAGGIVGNNYKVVQLQPKIRFADLLMIGSQMLNRFTTPWQSWAQSPTDALQKGPSHLAPFFDKAAAQ